MFLHRPLSIWLLTSVLLVVIVGGFAAQATQRNGYDIQPLPSPQRESVNVSVQTASPLRNLSLQPEAAKLSRRLGQR